MFRDFTVIQNVVGLIPKLSETIHCETGQEPILKTTCTVSLESCDETR